LLARLDLQSAMVASGPRVRDQLRATRGIRSRLGSQKDGYRAETQGLATSIEAFMWLHKAVLQHYPESDYAKAFLRRQSGVS
jgi:hypothetical protein